MDALLLGQVARGPRAARVACGEQVGHLLRQIAHAGRGGPFTFLPIAHAVLGARSWSACRFEALGELLAARAIARSAASSETSRSANLPTVSSSRRVSRYGSPRYLVLHHTTNMTLV